MIAKKSSGSAWVWLSTPLREKGSCLQVSQMWRFSPQTLLRESGRSATDEPVTEKNLCLLLAEVFDAVVVFSILVGLKKALEMKERKDSKLSLCSAANFLPARCFRGGLEPENLRKQRWHLSWAKKVKRMTRRTEGVIVMGREACRKGMSLGWRESSRRYRKRGPGQEGAKALNREMSVESNVVVIEEISRPLPSGLVVASSKSEDLGLTRRREVLGR